MWETLPCPPHRRPRLRVFHISLAHFPLTNQTVAERNGVSEARPAQSKDLYTSTIPENLGFSSEPLGDFKKVHEL
jgi:hypothetical protein